MTNAQIECAGSKSLAAFRPGATPGMELLIFVPFAVLAVWITGINVQEAWRRADSVAVGTSYRPKIVCRNAAAPLPAQGDAASTEEAVDREVKHAGVA